MLAVQEGQDQGPVRSPQCSPQLYRCAQTQWTRRLFVQMTLYVLFISVSMAAGGMMPWLLKHFWGITEPLGNILASSSGGNSSVAGAAALPRVYRQEAGYYYVNNNTYSYCRSTPHAAGSARGYPAPPLAPNGSQLHDAWHHKPVVPKGLAWPGFDQQPAGLEGLKLPGQKDMAATDLHAVVYQLKLLGFNTVKLPFSFDALRGAAANQTAPCNTTSSSSTKEAWAARATDPELANPPNLTALELELPDPAIYVKGTNGSCNAYIPGHNRTSGLEQLLWTVKYLIANGLYVVLSFQPGPGDASIYRDPQVFALAWLSLWTPITCLEHFAEDIRGRILLDLLNEPSRLGSGGVGWSSDGTQQQPGLEKLYLIAMDGIEGVTPRDALYMLQGTAANAYGLSPGDGFVLDEEAITAYQLSDPKPFLTALAQRPYNNRVLLAPHLLGPSSSDAAMETPEELVNRMNSSWGRLATEGVCVDELHQRTCIRLPVVAGEIGSQLDSDEEVQYYAAVVDYVVQAGGGPSQHLSGWIWGSYVGGPGPLLDNAAATLNWRLLRYLVSDWGLRPWYTNPTAWLTHANSDKQLDREAAAAAAAATTANVSAVAVSANMTQTLEKLYHKAAADATLLNSTVLPALKEATADPTAVSNATTPSSAATNTTTTSPVPAPAVPPLASPPVLPPVASSPAALPAQQPAAVPSPAVPPTAPLPAVPSSPAIPSPAVSDAAAPPTAPMPARAPPQELNGLAPPPSKDQGLGKQATQAVSAVGSSQPTNPVPKPAIQPAQAYAHDRQAPSALKPDFMLDAQAVQSASKDNVAAASAKQHAAPPQAPTPTQPQAPRVPGAAGPVAAPTTITRQSQEVTQEETMIDPLTQMLWAHRLAQQPPKRTEQHRSTGGDYEEPHEVLVAAGGEGRSSRG